MKKEIVLIGVGLLMLMFVLVSILTYLQPKSSTLIGRKIKLGLLIISLQTMISGCGSPGDDPPPECYAKPVTPDMIYLNGGQYVNGKYVLQWATNDSLIFSVENRQSRQFFYEISDSNGTVVCSGVLRNLRSETNLDLFAVPPIGLNQGAYTLKVFTSYPKRTDTTAAPVEVIDLYIERSDVGATITTEQTKVKSGSAGLTDTQVGRPDPDMIRCYLPPADPE